MPYILSRTALSWTPRRLPPSLRRRQSKRALGRASAGPHGSGGPPAGYGSFIAFESSINATGPSDVWPFPFSSPFRRTHSFLLPCLPCFLSLALGQHRILARTVAVFYNLSFVSFTTLLPLLTQFFSTLSHVSSARSPVRSLFLFNSLNFRRHYFPFLSSTHDPTKMPVGPAHVYKLAFSLP